MNFFVCFWIDFWMKKIFVSILLWENKWIFFSRKKFVYRFWIEHFLFIFFWENFKEKDWTSVRKYSSFFIFLEALNPLKILLINVNFGMIVSDRWFHDKQITNELLNMIWNLRQNLIYFSCVFEREKVHSQRQVFLNNEV